MWMFAALLEHSHKLGRLPLAIPLATVLRVGKPDFSSRENGQNATENLSAAALLEPSDRTGAAFFRSGG